ncbi:WD domain-containing protein [Coniochaeta ligniaria NRRL 30616]|uniref:ASTRA-associated protein 1 n=1 Tax=Coniochaeta ligniaria NRRL 30616 TaxID=1408157 RepID=A0A1J7IZY9_9PEZI|nr:WD domain-containing protein [Coniochaeta ligniaria NRRL 30616]
MADDVPLQPKTVLRGHKAQVHTATFIRHNDRLVTGDAEGFVVVWDLTIMRPRAVWRAHTNAILGISDWGDDRIITHGRDNRLVVWKLGADDEQAMSTVLPLDASPEERPQPWLLHLLEINTMNFCTFSSCPPATASTAPTSELLVAVPNTLASEAIDIFHLPSQRRLHTVKLGDKNGMVMALSLFYRAGRLVLVAAYENGLAVVAELNNDDTWVATYGANVHSQPILSLDVSADKDYFFTSSADAMIVKHPIPQAAGHEAQQPGGAPLSSDDTSPSENPSEKPAAGPSLLSAALASQPRSPRPAQPQPKGTTHIETEPLKVVNTKHSGQQSLKIRSDGRIFATAGWDSKIRVYSVKTMKEVAVLKWHQVGCYTVAFSSIDQDKDNRGSAPTEPASIQAEAPTSTSSAIVPKLVDISVRDKRIGQAKTAHWLAAGSKDGKVSLWDVF